MLHQTPFLQNHRRARPIHRRRRRHNYQNPFDYAQDYIADLPPGFRVLGIFAVLILVTLLSATGMYALIFMTKNMLNSILYMYSKVTYAIIR